MLAKLLELKDRDVISLTGAGGKTSLMFFLSKELADKKILISTTTKIYLPPREDYDYLGLGAAEAEALSRKQAKGIFLLAEDFLPDEKKLSGFAPEVLAQFIPRYELAIIESDGAKGKLLKAWRENEPLIVPNTTKTIGLLNFKLLGHPISETTIHRAAAYTKLTRTSLHQPVTLGQLKTLTLHPEGLFKNALGEKILCVNMMETRADKEALAQFIALFAPDELAEFGMILASSFYLKTFQRIV